MKAWISGSAQRALVKDGEGYFLITPKSADSMQQVDSTKLVLITRDWLDVYSISTNSIDDARQELYRAVLCFEALLVSSLAMDQEVEPHRRKLSAIEAERLLKEKYVYNYLLYVYCAHPMPDSADLTGMELICHQNDLRQLGEIIRAIDIFRNEIQAVRQSFDRITLELFGGNKEKVVFQAEAIRSGLFLSMTRRIGDQVRCRKLMEMLDKFEVSKLPTSNSVLAAWISEAVKMSPTAEGSFPLFTSKKNIQTTSAELRRPVLAHASVQRHMPAFT